MLAQALARLSPLLRRHLLPSMPVRRHPLALLGRKLLELLVPLHHAYWYPALGRTGIDDLHFHDLRHTFASRYMMAGGDLYTLQTLLGHKIAQMVRRYAHLSERHLRAAVELLATPGRKPWSEERQRN
jgi:integrase